MHHEDDRRVYASPACSLHAVGEDESGDTVQAWRRAERMRLIALRRAIGPDERKSLAAGISRGLDALLGDPGSRTVAVYWPIRGEPDLAPWYAGLAARGVSMALPVVEGREQPLVFHAWQPGDDLVPGALKIPVPKSARVVEPDVILSPLVGYDAERFRLGNGGGYFDRTLAGLAEHPLTIGVGYERCAIRSIYPQSWDVPMDYIVTEASVIPEPG